MDNESGWLEMSESSADNSNYEKQLEMLNGLFGALDSTIYTLEIVIISFSAIFVILSILLAFPLARWLRFTIDNSVSVHFSSHIGMLQDEVAGEAVKSIYRAQKVHWLKSEIIDTFKKENLARPDRYNRADQWDIVLGRLTSSSANTRATALLEIEEDILPDLSVESLIGPLIKRYIVELNQIGVFSDAKPMQVATLLARLDAVYLQAE